MRTYARNSPQAAARIVALSMIADGHLSQQEMLTLQRLDVDEQLGLASDQMHNVMQALCEDLLLAAHNCWSDACRVDPLTLSQFLAEVTDPQLQAKVIALCVATVEADGHVSEGESILVSAAVEQWGLQRQMVERRERLDPAPLHAG